jgi:nucleolar protein 56
MEERLKFLTAGTKPRKNVDAMKEVLEELRGEGLYYDGKKEGAANGKKRDKKK